MQAQWEEKVRKDVREERGGTNEVLTCELKEEHERRRMIRRDAAFGKIKEERKFIHFHASCLLPRGVTVPREGRQWTHPSLPSQRISTARRGAAQTRPACGAHHTAQTNTQPGLSPSSSPQRGKGPWRAPPTAQTSGASSRLSVRTAASAGASSTTAASRRCDAAATGAGTTVCPGAWTETPTPSLSLSLSQLFTP